MFANLMRENRAIIEQNKRVLEENRKLMEQLFPSLSINDINRNGKDNRKEKTIHRLEEETDNNNTTQHPSGGNGGVGGVVSNDDHDSSNKVSNNNEPDFGRGHCKSPLPDQDHSKPVELGNANANDSELGYLSGNLSRREVLWALAEGQSDELRDQIRSIIDEHRDMLGEDTSEQDDDDDCDDSSSPTMSLTSQMCDKNDEEEDLWDKVIAQREHLSKQTTTLAVESEQWLEEFLREGGEDHRPSPPPTSQPTPPVVDNADNESDADNDHDRGLESWDDASDNKGNDNDALEDQQAQAPPPPPPPPSSKFPCIFPDCVRSFKDDAALARHERTHTGIRPFGCAWPGCREHYEAKQKGHVERHIRKVHFKLRLNQTKDVNEWVQVNQLESERLTRENLQFYINKSNDSEAKVDGRQKQKKARDPKREYKFACKSPGCGKSFSDRFNLRLHKRGTRKVKPFRCTWPNCAKRFVSTQRSNVVTHVRTVHFGLPETVKRQLEEGIIDDRNPNEYVSVNQDELERRVE